ncbi:Nucleotide-diphospho-sugar transferase family protein [Abeliophyllum distichum]|uniref:Nucleotide-diphospho-sugar transferase family protein n=1 Tax=Abeliophyllum distichum TaxID=126358 RepID=A0ABD1PAL2_9LAMI
MDYSKNSITNLAILSLLLATVILLCSWAPLTGQHFFSFKKHPLSEPNSTIAKDELEIALEKASMAGKTVIIAIVNKAYVEPHSDEYPTMFDLFLEGFWVGEETRSLVDHLLLVAMDQTAYDRCKFRRLNCYKVVTGDSDFAGEKLYMSDEFIKMMWRRTLFLLNVLKRGYSFIFTDTDVLWLRNPFPRLSKNEKIDLQISTDRFNGNASPEKNQINTGFYFIRSNDKTISLFEKWYGMRDNSTGLKEQDVLENLVRGGVLKELGLNARILETLYFSGFCTDSENVTAVATVHANCCRSIAAKVADLKAVLRDWKGFKGAANNTSINNFQWSSHVFCRKSWAK